MSDWVFRRPHDYRTKQSPIFTLLAIASATSGSAAVALTATGALTGGGALAGSSAIVFDGLATTQDPNLSGTSGNLLSATATPTAISAAVGVAAITLTAGATLQTDAASYFQRIFTYAKWQRQPYRHGAYTDRLVIFPYSPPTTASGQADIVFTPTGTLLGTGTYAGSTASALVATGTLRGAGALVGAGAVTFTPSATLAAGAQGAITGMSDNALGAVGLLLGAGELAGLVVASLAASLAPGSIQPAAGTSSISFIATGRMRGAVPSIDTPRKRTTFSKGRR